MKANLSEYLTSFGVELVPETTEEILRVARLGLTTKKAIEASIYFGETQARISLRSF